MATLITGAEVHDGTGAGPAAVDVAVEGEYIAAVAPELPRTGATTVDGSGLVLAPGFIDFHSHADFTLPSFPGAANSISQGVTTEVIGNCGASPAPLTPAHRSEYQAGTAMLGPELDWRWSSFAEYLGTLDAAGPAVNCVPLVGHGAVRAAVIGMADREATPAELTEMRRLTAAAMAAGAWGLSTGLVYPPSSYGDATEITALADVVRRRGGIHASHIRDEESRLIVAIDEIIAVAETTGVRSQISHLKSSGPANHGQIDSALARIDRARASGLPIGFDAYPYEAASTALSQLLPAWALVGGVDDMVARLRSSEQRARMLAEMEDDPDSFLNAAGGWSGVMVKGRRVAETAPDDPAAHVFDLIVAERGATAVIAFTMHADDVAAALVHPAGVIGSDQFGVPSPTAPVHPRAYGSFARVLSRAVAGDRLPEAIHGMTARPAARLGLTERGVIRPGAVADLVLFDPQEIRDQATYDDSTALAVGIELVLVAGAPADERRGRVLRRQPRVTV